MSRARDSAKLIGNNTLTIDGSNNVGIGSTLPTADLDVSGNIVADNFVKSEGTIVIVPSFTLHFVYPNQSRKQRTIVSFDLLPIDC